MLSVTGETSVSRDVGPGAGEFMLCEKCREREATVHVTVVTPESVLERREFCESCAPTPDQMKEEAIRTFLSDKRRRETSGEKSTDEI